MKQLIATLIVPAILSAAGCATVLTPGAEKVQVVTSGQKETSCKSIKIISVQQKLEPDKAGNAMRKAINETAALGGNGIYVVSSNLDWSEGASVVAEALKCSF